MTTTLPSSKRLPLQLPLLPTDNQITVAEIDAFAGALNGCYAEMSPKAKAYALELAHALTKIRFKLIQ